jgi:very-short-patch-repair endonuclease
MRQGFEINTMYRFAERHGAQDVVRASISSQDEHIASATYGASTTIWKVNAGWRRRKNKEQLGFFLDMDRGIWSRKENEPTRAGDDAPGRPAAIKRVLPFVEDHRNALLLEFAVDIKTSALLSLQYALKHGIETLYQLEESELAVEPLPSAGSPRSILLYEASEGGAGVLTRLVREPRALAQVARTALELCHFDPDTGADLGRAPGAQEDCHAACYDCLLSYSNQRVHELLDRKNAAPVLFQLATATAVVGAGGRSRDDQLERLLSMCESDLERDFLRWLFAHGYRLPDRAQAQVAGLPNHIDFVYEGDLVAVSVDGYPHSFDPQREKDKALDSALLCAGWTSVRVGGADTWAAQIAAHSYLFGEGKPS